MQYFFMESLTDRIAHARALAAGKRVLDIGGQKMPDCDAQSPFARAYQGIERAAKEYRIADVQNAPSVDYVLDLNTAEGVTKLHAAVDAYRPEVILCMETLEHINYHFETMNEIARAIERDGATAFITLPNNGNWVFNALGWNHDHSIAFFKDIADRFVRRSDLGRHTVTLHACMQQYLWYWPLVWLLGGGQPFSWGFTIRPGRGTGGKN